MLGDRSYFGFENLKVYQHASKPVAAV